MRKTLSGPVVAVECDGMRAAWCDGFFTGDAALVKEAKWAASVNRLVGWGDMPEPVEAGDTDAWSALAALMSYDPGRTRVTVWPQDLRRRWNEQRYACSHVRSVS